MGSKIFGALTLVLAGGIIADILRNPAGTAAAGTALSGILRPAFNTVLGYKS
jgi:hypothetical protein